VFLLNISSALGRTCILGGYSCYSALSFDMHYDRVLISSSLVAIFWILFFSGMGIAN
jgi:hypothetical protein